MSLDLEGKRILVTRPKGQAAQLANRLVELGAIPVYLPAIEIAAPLDFSDFHAALKSANRFDWVIFTSVNGVAAVIHQMEKLGLKASTFSRAKIAVIGPATAEAVRKALREPDLMPKEYVSEGISSSIDPIAGQKFLLLRADIARKELANELRAKGGEVTEIAVYRIVTEEGSQLAENEPVPDYITLTSSSSVHATLAKLREAGRESWMRKVPIACIGPITAKTVTDLGYKVAAGASEYTVPGMVDAIVEHARSKNHA